MIFPTFPEERKWKPNHFVSCVDSFLCNYASNLRGIEIIDSNESEVVEKFNITDGEKKKVVIQKKKLKFLIKNKTIFRKMLMETKVVV